jgi:hypothetical protein
MDLCENKEQRILMFHGEKKTKNAFSANPNLATYQRDMVITLFSSNHLEAGKELKVSYLHFGPPRTLPNVV